MDAQYMKNVKSISFMLKLGAQSSTCSLPTPIPTSSWQLLRLNSVKTLTTVLGTLGGALNKSYGTETSPTQALTKEGASPRRLQLLPHGSTLSCSCIFSFTQMTKCH